MLSIDLFARYPDPEAGHHGKLHLLKSGGGILLMSSVVILGLVTGLGLYFAA
jgi:hypothetical protein